MKKEAFLLEFDARGRLNLGKELENQYLTPREVDILKCLLRGLCAKETGQELGISYRTVESYLEAIKLKLRCGKKSKLIEFCIKFGLFKLVTNNFVNLVFLVPLF